MIVVILPDGGRNYLSKLYNDEWMRANGLLTTTGAVDPGRRAARRRATTARSCPTSSSPGRPTASAPRSTLLQRYGISQMPVSERADDDAIEGIVGSISEKGLLDRAYRDPSVVERTVGEVMDPPLPLIDARGVARRRVRAAVRRRAGARRRRAATGRPASSRSSTCSSTSPTAAAPSRDATTAARSPPRPRNVAQLHDAADRSVPRMLASPAGASSARRPPGDAETRNC